MKTYLHGPMDFAKRVKLQFCVGNLDLPENVPEVERRRKKIPRCPLVVKQKRVEHTLWEKCEMYKEERDVLVEEMKLVCECEWRNLVLKIIARKQALS